MPCIDGRDFDPKYIREEYSRQIRKVDAMLCAVVSTIDDVPAMIEKIDWKEAGIKKREFLNWWDNHKKADEERREKLKKAAYEATAKKAALEKLTKEERILLGLE